MTHTHPVVDVLIPAYEQKLAALAAAREERDRAEQMIRVQRGSGLVDALLSGEQPTNVHEEHVKFALDEADSNFMARYDDAVAEYDAEYVRIFAPKGGI